MRKILFLFLFICLSTMLLQSQTNINLKSQITGKLAGKVMDESGNSLPDVSVFIDELKMGTYTKSNGSFIISKIPIGIYTVHVQFMGFKTQSKKITIQEDITSTLNFNLEQQAIEIEGFKVTATRAVERETPIAFTNINENDISDKYTTEDVPMLIDEVPGVFSSSQGLGDSEITMRGFSADKIQILINGIPVNDPESQVVYWSNWTGLSSNVKSVQVQRGAGSSMYGSGAFGGSINIETMGSKPKQTFTFRTSAGGFFMDETKTADGKGNKEDYDPMNYNVLLRYNSGNIAQGRLNFNFMFERKAGDSYVHGTNYDGYSMGAEIQSVIGQHTLNLSYIGAPQKHNQARKTSDIELMKTLGRNYNRDNHPYQENYYFKPQLSLRDEWNITDETVVMTNIFITQGNGGGKYLYNSTFNVDTGEVGFQDLFDADDQAIAMGKHARFIYETYGFILEGYTPENPDWFNSPTYTPASASDGDLPKFPTVGIEFFAPGTEGGQGFVYSFRNNSKNVHSQQGANTYIEHKFSESFKVVLGGEARHWTADHYANREKLRINDPFITDSLDPDSVIVALTLDNTQKRYDYSSVVTNLSGFLRTNFKPIETINIVLDGQYAIYNSSVEENPIRIFDYGYGHFTDYYFYGTKDIPLRDPETNLPLYDDDGNIIKKYNDDDYKKTFSFFSPKTGINWNATESINFLSNFSVAYKEPKVGEWYNRSDGPDYSQIYNEAIVDTLSDGTPIDTTYVQHFLELVPEKATTYEFGVGYHNSIFDLSANYYYTYYLDKITRTQDEKGNSLTINAGKAVHKGIELSGNFDYFNVDGSFSATFSQNRWEKMNLKEIFYEPAEEIVGKVVPYSPEQMINTSIGYTFENIPLKGKIRIGLTTKWWDNYYANYTNEYYTDYIWDEVLQEDVPNYKKCKLPAYFEVGSDIKYNFDLFGKDAFLKFAFGNILNRSDNYNSAYFTADHNRYKMVLNEDTGEYESEGDYLNHVYTMYVTPAPLFNVFVTLELKF